jgi:hypothetical protein
LCQAIAGTLATEFPRVMVWPALRFNHLVLGFSREVPVAELARRAQDAPEEVLPLSRLLTRDWRSVEPSADYWTDDRAPVEWITDRMIVRYGLSGADRSEELLPTAP